MSRYYTCFEDNEIGKFPSDWTWLWFNSELFEFKVKYLDVPVKSRGLWMKTLQAATFVEQCAAWDTPGNVLNPDVLTIFKCSEAGSPGPYADHYRIYARASGAYGASSAYFVLVSFGGGGLGQGIYLYRVAAGSPIFIAAMPLGFVLSPSAAYFLRFRVQDLAGSPSTTTLQARIWEVGDPEPSSWSIETTDANLFGQSGKVGLYTHIGTGIFNFLSVGTDGDVAWTPRTNDEFTAWLSDASAVRRCLVEMQVMGYEPGGSGGAVMYLDIPTVMGGSPSVPPASSPDSTAADITGDLELQAEVNFAAGVFGSVVSKWDDIAPFQKSYFFYVGTTGIPTIFWTADGSSQLSLSATASISAGERAWIRVTLDVDNGAGGRTAKFFTSSDGSNWTQLGADVTAAGTTSIFSGTESLRIGTQSNAFLNTALGSKIYRVKALNGILGPLAFEFYPDRDAGVAHAGSFVSASTGETWTVNAPAYIEPLTYTEPRNAYIADGGFPTQSWDTPPSRFFEPWLLRAPSIRKEMALAFNAGRVSTAIGTLDVANPRDVINGGGVRDDWLRMKWIRAYVPIWIGDQSWPKSDFRMLQLGTIQQPTAPSADVIRFEVRDVLDTLDREIDRNRFTDLFEGQPKPLLIGRMENIEPTRVSASSLVYQVNDGPYSLIGLPTWEDGGETVGTGVYDNAVPLSAGGLLLSGSAATDVLTTDYGSPSVPHGLAVNDRLACFPFSTGSPTSLPEGQTLYVKTVPSPFTLTVSLLPGGSTVDIVSNFSGVTFEYAKWREDRAAGTITLNSNPAGVVTIPTGVERGADNANQPGDVLQQIFDLASLSEDFIDTAALDALGASAMLGSCGLYILDEAVGPLDLVHRLATGIFAWYDTLPDGRITFGRLDLPESSAVMTLNASDIADGVIQLQRVLLPVRRELLSITHKPAVLRSGPLQVFSIYEEPLRPYLRYGQFPNPEAPSVPLDLNQGLSESGDPPVLDSVFCQSPADEDFFNNNPPFSGGVGAEWIRLDAFYTRKIGVFAFRTRMKAIELRMGQTIQVDAPQLGWTNWGGSPNSYSPDDPAAFDASKAVVLGMEYDPAAESFPVTLTVFRQIPGYYPTGDLN